MRHLYRTKKYSLSAVGALAAFLAVLALFLVLLRGADGAAGHQSQAQLESALRRAAATCYAVEGRYPPSLDYLQEHYGVYVDRGSYAVGYEVFASNMMPDITVRPKGVS